MTSKAVTREQFEIKKRNGSRSYSDRNRLPSTTVYRSARQGARASRGGVEREFPRAIFSNRSKAWRLSCCLNEQLEIAGWASRLRMCDWEAAMAWIGRTNFSENRRWNLSPLRGNPYDPWTRAQSSPSEVRDHHRNGGRRANQSYRSSA